MILVYQDQFNRTQTNLICQLAKKWRLRQTIWPHEFNLDSTEHLRSFSSNQTMLLKSISGVLVVSWQSCFCIRKVRIYHNTILFSPVTPVSHSLHVIKMLNNMKKFWLVKTISSRKYSKLLIHLSNVILNFWMEK